VGGGTPRLVSGGHLGSQASWRTWLDGRLGASPARARPLYASSLLLELAEAAIQIVDLVPAPLEIQCPKQHIEKVAKHCTCTTIEAAITHGFYRAGDLTLYAGKLFGWALSWPTTTTS
jgi:hypothetical protein